MNPFRSILYAIIFILIAVTLSYIIENLNGVSVKLTTTPFEVTEHKSDPVTINCGNGDEEYYATIIKTPRVFGIPISISKETVTRYCE